MLKIDSGTEVAIKLEKTIETGLRTQGDSTGPMTPVIAIHLLLLAGPTTEVSDVEAMKESDAAVSLMAKAAYEAVFSPLPAELDRNSALEAVRLDLASAMVMQAYPVIFSNFINQVRLMGVSTNRMALGIESSLIAQLRGESGQTNKPGAPPKQLAKRKS